MIPEEVTILFVKRSRDPVYDRITPDLQLLDQEVMEHKVPKPVGFRKDKTDPAIGYPVAVPKTRIDDSTDRPAPEQAIA
jgi:hypothetical protein